MYQISSALYQLGDRSGGPTRQQGNWRVGLTQTRGAAGKAADPKKGRRCRGGQGGVGDS